YLRARRFDLREKTLSNGCPGPKVYGGVAFFGAPRFEGLADTCNCDRRIFTADDGFVENAGHVPFRGELRDSQRILLALVRMAMNVDGVFDADNVVERRIDRSLLKAAARGIGCHRAYCARSRIVGSGIGHGQPPDCRYGRNIARPFGAGKPKYLKPVWLLRHCRRKRDFSLRSK